MLTAPREKVGMMRALATAFDEGDKEMLGDWVQEQSAGFEIDTTLAECLRRSDHADCGAYMDDGNWTFDRAI